MNLRDLKPSILKRLGTECMDAYRKEEVATNGWRTFGKQEPLSAEDIWRLAFSAGARTILRRVDTLKEDV